MDGETGCFRGNASDGRLRGSSPPAMHCLTASGMGQYWSTAWGLGAPALDPLSIISHWYFLGHRASEQFVLQPELSIHSEL